MVAHKAYRILLRLSLVVVTFFSIPASAQSSLPPKSESDIEIGLITIKLGPELLSSIQWEKDDGRGGRGRRSSPIPLTKLNILREQGKLSVLDQFHFIVKDKSKSSIFSWETYVDSLSESPEATITVRMDWLGKKNSENSLSPIAIPFALPILLSGKRINNFVRELMKVRKKNKPSKDGELVLLMSAEKIRIAAEGIYQDMHRFRYNGSRFRYDPKKEY